MAHKITANLLRLNYSRLWQNTWCNNHLYGENLLQDLRFSQLVKAAIKRTPFRFWGLKISRTKSSVFVLIKILFQGFAFHDNNTYLKLSKKTSLDQPTEEDKPKKNFKLIFENISWTCVNLSFIIKTKLWKVLSVSNSIVFYRLLVFGNWRFNTFNSFFKAFSLKNTDRLALEISKVFLSTRRKPFGKAFGIVKSLLRSKAELRSLGIKGFKIKFFGPVSAPRNRRKKIIGKTVGKLPITNFQSYVNYASNTVVNKHGSFGVKIWVYKGYSSLLASGNTQRRASYKTLKKKQFFKFVLLESRIVKITRYRYLYIKKKDLN